MMLQQIIEGCHHTTGDVVQTDAVDTQIDFRSGHLKVIEEGRLQRGVILASCIDQHIGCFVAFLNGTDEWCYLYEVGTGTGHNGNSFHSVMIEGLLRILQEAVDLVELLP